MSNCVARNSHLSFVPNVLPSTASSGFDCYLFFRDGCPAVDNLYTFMISVMAVTTYAVFNAPGASVVTVLVLFVLPRSLS